MAAGFAGCSGGSGSGGSDTIDCRTGAFDHGDGDVLDGGASATIEDDEVRLSVPLSVETVRQQRVAALELYDRAGELAHLIPVSAGDADVMANKQSVSEGQLRYEQYVGRRPAHGQLRVVAVNDAGDSLDTVTVQFNCFAEVQG